MSDAKQDRPDWGFTGNLVACEERTTKAGKTFLALVLKRERGKYTDLCCAVYFGTVPDTLEIGAQVKALGRIGGREYNGKHYSDLTATSLTVQAAAPKREELDFAADDAVGEASGARDNDPTPF